jgi:peptidyl-prolyl cis-trans isomerase D
MFDTVRNHQRALQFVLLLLILPSFVFFGLSGYDRFLGKDDSVATVGDRKIARLELEGAVREQVARMRASLGPNADSQPLETPQLRAQVLDSLIDERALDLYANRQHLVVGDDALRRAIAAQTDLLKPDGSFDRDRYRELLAAQGRTESAFETELRRDIARSLIPQAFGQSAVMPKRVSERLMQGLVQTREVATLRFRPTDYLAQLQPTDDQLLQFHRDESKRFTTPPTAKVAWVVLSAGALSRQVQISDDDLRSYYEQNRARLGRPERRRASHVLIQVAASASEADVAAAKSKAQGLLDQLKDASADRFAALARQQSDDAGSKAGGGDLDWFTRDSMVKPFADAVFAAAGVGTIGEVVRSEFGFHIIRVTGVEPEQVKPFAEVREQLDAEIRKQQASKRYAESAEPFSNLVYEQGDTLDAPATRFGLTVHTVDGVTPDGPAKANIPVKNPPKPDSAVDGSDTAVLSNRRLLTALFSEESIRTRRNTEAVETSAGTLVSARIVDYQPAQVRPLDSVRAEVKALWIQTQSRKMALNNGTEKLKSLQSREAPTSGSTATDSVRFEPGGKISRMDRGSLSPAIVNAVLGAAVDKLPAFVGVDLGEEGYIIARIDAVLAGDLAAVKANEAQLTAQIRRTEGEQAVLAWLKSWQAQLGVKRSPP